MSKKYNTPQLRFPGFEGEWKEKKLSDVFTRLTKKNTEDNKNILTISAQYGLISQLDFFKKSVSASDVTGYYLLRKGDFAYNKSSSQGRPVGAIKPLKLYDKGVVSTLYICFKCKDPNAIGFWEQYFDASIFDKEIMSIAQEGARNHGLLNVPTKGFFDLTVLEPTPTEQKKIAECLEEIDKLIAAQGEKVDALKEKKKGLMQQLFPQQGKTTPRLRFPGFKGEWEEKTLKEVSSKINKRNSQLEYTRVLTNSANVGVVDQNEYFDRDIAVKENTSNYHVIELNDFVYNPRISTAAPVGPISINKTGRGIMSPLYTVFRFHTGYIPFFEQYFQTTIWHQYLKSIANFGARFDRMNINTEGFFNMSLFIPSPEEQKKIADFLSEMDESIASESAKLDALKDHKRGLMQQLFPQPNE